MYGCAPAYLTTSMASYVHYCGSPVTLQFNQKEQKYVKATMRDFMGHLKWFLISFSIVGLIQSFAYPSHYEPFGSLSHMPWYDPNRLFHPTQLGNNLIVAMLMQGYVTTAAEGLIAATVLLTGYKCEHVMENPMMLATSPSHFWGKCWNRLIHSVLKRGVYIPLRKHAVSRPWAAVGAFVASGLFHEWLLTFVFEPLEFEKGPHGECELPRCYHAPLGGSTAFMLYNALFVVLEYGLGGTKPIAMFVKYVPTPLRTAALIMLGLLVVHWFCHAYTTSNFFDHGKIALPFIKEII